MLCYALFSDRLDGLFRKAFKRGLFSDVFHRLLMTSRVMLIPNYFARRQTKDTICTHCCPNKDQKKTVVLPHQKSRTQLHIATYWIFTIQKLVCKQMFICYDLSIVSWLCMTLYVLFRVLFLCFIFAVLLFTVHLCAIDTRFNKCNLLTYLL